jgi:hypothetical protein
MRLLPRAALRSDSEQVLPPWQSSSGARLLSSVYILVATAVLSGLRDVFLQ